MSTVLFKLGTLAIRTLSKPIASTIQARATKSGPFRSICISLAQGVNRTEHFFRNKLSGKNKTPMRPLNDAKAIETGAKFLSETFLFSVAGSLIIFESVRTRNANQTRRDAVAEDILQLQQAIAELRHDVNAMRQDLSNSAAFSTMTSLAQPVRPGYIEQQTLKERPASGQRESKEVLVEKGK
ncbi:hypothetical protein CANCADRAFT_4220 [Tortispora caseinolytica NRRL Y-17796]|uniref:OPA3-like protein n=1 Tax=Tortispora caseinolytica NRRL Y-17796 TaxID=767744 RepID=A0A1E4TCV3_9ASCO|nr:hypothetical protein CANCADRAFT_4220 [Tortispora caseinolytica NRRL Y-17796]